MGGYGSGRYYRSKKLVIEDCLCLSINHMVKLGAIKPDTHRAGSWVWQDAETGEQNSVISYTSNTLNPDDMFLRLQYRTVSDDESHDYKVRIERTPLHFGGHRYWFSCPYTGKRVTKLYKAYGVDKYASRHALNLSYASQSEAPRDRVLRKRWKMLDKLDGEYDWPVRPKGMHQKTFEDILDKYHENEDIISQHLLGFLSTMQGRHPL